MRSVERKCMRVRTAQPCCIIYRYFFILLSMQNWLNNEVIQKLCWKTVQAFSVTGNAMPFYNQIILDIIHLILANFFSELENFYNGLLEQQITKSEWDFISSRGSLVLCVCVLTRWQCAEPPKKSGRATEQQMLLYILLFHLLQCI